MMNLLQNAVNSLSPNSEYCFDGNDIDSIEWLSKKTKPTKEAIQTEMDRLQVEYDAQEYARKRQAEYPTIAELTVALYDTDDKADIEAKRAAVKAKYPKP